MPLIFSRKLKEQSYSEYKGDLSIVIPIPLGLRMGERRDEESILRTLSSSAKILALAVLASLIEYLYTLRWLLGPP